VIEQKGRVVYGASLYYLGHLLVRLRAYNPAASVFEKAFTIDPRHDRARNYHAWSLGRAGRYVEAVAAYRRFLERRPQVTGARIELASVWQALENHREATSLLEEAIAQDPMRADAHELLGDSLIALGRTDEASRSYRRAVRLNPSSADACASLGAALGTLRRWEEAAHWHREAMRLRPNASAARNLGVVLTELDRPEEAERVFRESIRRQRSGSEDSAEVTARLALTLVEQDKTDEALQLLLPLISRQPDQEAPRIALAMVRMVEDRLPEALEIAEGVVRRNPRMPEAQAAVGWIRLRMQHGDDALTAFDAVRTLKPAWWDIELGRAAALSLLGRHREAVEVFAKVIADDPRVLERHSELRPYYAKSSHEVDEERRSAD
jgi:tetratricopeptide (TPR) repeat protein